MIIIMAEPIILGAIWDTNSFQIMISQNIYAMYAYFRVMNFRSCYIDVVRYR